jgi:hypothetical protein
MVRRAAMTLTTAKKVVKKAAVISVQTVRATTTARVAIVKRAADVGDKMARPGAKARVAMPRKVLVACVAKDHPVVTARPERATKAVVDQKAHVATVRLQVTALAANTGLARMDQLTRRVQVPINPIRPAHLTKNMIRTKATTSPKPPFKSL